MSKNAQAALVAAVIMFVAIIVIICQHYAIIGREDSLKEMVVALQEKIDHDLQKLHDTVDKVERYRNQITFYRKVMKQMGILKLVDERLKKDRNKRLKKDRDKKK